MIYFRANLKTCVLGRFFSARLYFWMNIYSTKNDVECLCPSLDWKHGGENFHEAEWQSLTLDLSGDESVNRERLRSYNV